MPAKPVVPPESFSDMTFPVHGIDVAAAFAEQRPQTTPVGINCRAYEPSTLRARGGARPGLSKYLPVPTVLGAEIQDLAVVIDPQADSMGISFLDVPDLDLNFQIEDPTGFQLADGTINWVFAEDGAGGSGFYTNHAYTRKHPPGIKFVQKVQGATSSAGAVSAAFASPVKIGHLLVVAVHVDGNGSSTAAVTDSLGNTYAQAGSYQGLFDVVGITAGMFFAVSAANGNCTVTVTPSGDATGTIFYALEYSGLAIAPLDGTSSNNFSVTSTSFPADSIFSTGTITVSTSPELVVCFFDYGGNAYVGLTSGFTERFGFNTVGSNLLVDAVAATSSGNVSMVGGYGQLGLAPPASGLYGALAIGASFKKT